MLRIIGIIILAASGGYKLYDYYGRLASQRSSANTDFSSQAEEFEESDLISSIGPAEYQFDGTLILEASATPDPCLFASLVNVNCRESDDRESTITAILLAGEEAKLVAVNPLHSHGKFTLASQQECWIFLELMDVPEDPSLICQVPIVNAPLPQVSPSGHQPKGTGCTVGLDEQACIAAGGVWARSLYGRGNCTCK